MAKPAQSHNYPGWSTVTPSITVDDGDVAIAFYQEAFGAVLGDKLTSPDGAVMHAELRIGDSLFMLGESMGSDWPSPTMLGGTPSSLSVAVEDVDAVYARAIEAGGTEVMPVADQFYGARSGRIRDPSGHHWVISTVIEELTPEEMQQRADEWLAQWRAQQAE